MLEKLMDELIAPKQRVVIEQICSSSNSIKGRFILFFIFYFLFIYNKITFTRNLRGKGGAREDQKGDNDILPPSRQVILVESLY